MFYEPVFEYADCVLVRRPDTPYYNIYQYQPHAKRVYRKSTRTNDLEAAKRVLMEHAQARGLVPPRSPREISLIEVLDTYLAKDGERDFRRYAIPAAVAHLKRFARTEGIGSVAEMTLIMQDRYASWRRSDLIAKGHTGSNGTLKRELGVLKAAIRHAWKHGVLSECLPVQSVPTPPPRQRFLTAAECRMLIEACHELHLRLFVTLSLHTLQRPKAILRLRVEQIDLAMNRIDFHTPGTPVTNKRAAVVPITPTLREHLVPTISLSRSGHLVEYHGRPVRSIRTAFLRARDRAGLGRDVTPYTLRHTGATLLAAAGVPMRQISGMLGHSHSKTTELYAKHAPDFLGDAARTLEGLFSDDGIPATAGDSRHMA